MSRHAIKETLAELAAVTEEVIAQAEAADARMEELSAASEALLEQRVANGVPMCRPDPQRAIATLRDTLAVRAAREYREAAREFAAWWADLAALAVLAAVTGRTVHPARAAAADPTTLFQKEDLQHLPEVPEATRELARMAAMMAATPLGPRQADDDMAELAADYAARAGLRFGRGDDGQVVAKQDGTPEARRCRLWGEAWTEARVPALPAADELAELLAGYGAPAQTVTAVREAAGAVEDAVTALLRVREIESGDSADEAASAEQAEDIECLWGRTERLTELLAQYARILTGSLPVLQADDHPYLSIP